MSYGITLEICGEYALFSRPEMKVERVSYDVITPSAARGVIEAIYWKPQFRWVIDRIRVLNPIRFTNIRRNEVGGKIPMTAVTSAMKGKRSDLGVFVEENRQQRASLLLTDVRYWIDAHIEILDHSFVPNGPPLPTDANIAKHLEIFKRRIRGGQHFHHPYLGCREFPARVRLPEPEEHCPPPHSSLLGERDLGFVLHDILFDQNPRTKAVKNTTPRFYRAHMRDGVIEIPPISSKELLS